MNQKKLAVQQQAAVEDRDRRREATVNQLREQLTEIGVTDIAVQVRLLGPFHKSALDRGAGALWPILKARVDEQAEAARANPWLLDNPYEVEQFEWLIEQNRPMRDLRTCPHCGKRKAESEFGSAPWGCRPCVAEYHRARRASIKRTKASEIIE